MRRFFTLQSCVPASPEKTSYTVDDEAFELATPERDGYLFVGWTWAGQTEPVKIVTIAAGSTGNRTFTANWKSSSYTVWYVRNNFGLDYRSRTASKEYGEEYYVENEGNWTHTNYEFYGWNTERDGTGTFYAVGTPLTEVQSFEDDQLILYAQWRLVNYGVVIFDKNDPNATGAMSDQQIRTGRDVTLNQNLYRNKHHKFEGWSTEPEGQVEYGPGAAINISEPGSIILYALWEPDVYEIEIEGADPIYEKYGDGFYSDEKCKNPLDDKSLLHNTATFHINGTEDVPGANTLEGYYDDANLVINSEGKFLITNAKYFTSNRALTLKYKETVTVDVPDPVSPGMAFGGWLRAGKNQILKYGDVIEDFVEGEEFYAIWYQFAGGTPEYTRGSSSALGMRFITVGYANEIPDLIFGRFNTTPHQVYFDGNPIGTGEYTAFMGSLVISLKPSFLDSQSTGKHTVTVTFDNGVTISGTMRINSADSGSPSKPVDNVVTCQMAGFPGNYAWNESAKACQPGYIDAAGVFHPYKETMRKTTPNTSDNSSLMIYAWISLLAVTLAVYCGVRLLHEDWEV